MLGAHVPLHQHPHGVRVDVDGHACPECPIFYPNVFCRTCHGRGLVTTLELAVWQRRHLAEAR